MEIKKAKAALQAILFASGEPISLERLALAVEVDKATVDKLIRSLMDDFDGDDSGICIIQLGDKYQMCTKSAFSEFVRKAMDLRRHTPLSQAAMEVLAIIAYNQPVTKSFVENIRGVDCSSIVSNLCVRNLIEEKGRLDLPGRPLIYGTTLNFLKCFGISSVEELPELKKDEEPAEEVEAAAEAKAEIEIALEPSEDE